jgi:carbohydrate kinase (thermoresistant glucokinase family)
MPRITGLRSPHAKVGRIVLFGRMLDKIRLHARGALPPEYQANLGEAKATQFDGRCCRFLGVPYEDVRTRALQGGCDEEILVWAHARGAARTDEECVNWNRFITKIGWRDDRSAVLRENTAKFGIVGAVPETICELIDLDEGRAAGATRSWEGPPVSAVIAMGVAGSGKSTVGASLARELGWEFLEGDAFHPPSNVAKMAAGTPLDDADRAPWLAALREAIEGRLAAGARLVVACSALRESYRAALAPDPAAIRFVHLRGDYEVLQERIGGRTGHFMRPEMLRSQFDALEEPRDALALDVLDPPQVLIDQIRETFSL